MNAQELHFARQQALARSRSGDADALGELLESYRPYLRVIAHAMRDRRLQAQMDDSDLIQDALLEARRSFGSFRGATVAELTVWMRQVALRSCRRTLRRFGGADKRNPAREEAVKDLAEFAADSGSSPSAVAMRHEQAARMAETLARLPAEMQEVILARHVDGMAHGAIAKALGRSEGAVRMLYVRAIRRLRELYRD
jgi:RNA polymerase sigma-70 factor, ECF subfamily